MPRRKRIGLVASMALPLAALACNALSGAGDLAVGACDTCAAIDAQGLDSSNVDGMSAVVPETGGGPIDASVDAVSDGAAMRPSFCNGIAIYVRFDGTLATASGVTPDAPPAASFVPGRFGSAAVVTGATGALFYVTGSAGVPFDKSEGTVAMWLKPQWTWPSAPERIIWKPVPTRMPAAPTASGPHMLNGGANGFFGSSNVEPNGNVETAGGTVGELAPYWSAGWNHLVETWSQSSSPTISFTLNGADGDSSVTHRETTMPWQPQSATLGYVRLGSDTYPSDSAYDDVVIWNRPLGLAEVQAVYRAGAPVGDVCGL